MIRYYTNRELAQKLEVNLARWKRWSRSFLPPDPLGGMQSGYARQYLFKDLFKVFLGGFLLRHLKLSVAESQQVLTDISPWLKTNGFYDWSNSNPNGKRPGGQKNAQTIFFCPATPAGVTGPIDFRYVVRETIRRADHGGIGNQGVSITYKETFFPAAADPTLSPLDHPEVRMINLSALFNRVVEQLTQGDEPS